MGREVRARQRATLWTLAGVDWTEEYEFDISGECRNVVSSLPAKSCSGNVLLVSFVGVSDALVPNLGGTDWTVASLEFDVTVPTTKPVTNVAQLLHCRSQSQLDIQDLRVAPCSNIIASRQYELWPVIPELTPPGRRRVRGHEFHEHRRHLPRRIFVFAFYLDHWWCQQRALSRRLRVYEL